MSLSGLLLVHKPIGISSFAVVSRARKALNIKRIGHCGTLDPFAEGLLVLAVGSATKALQHLIQQDKVYTADVAFGVTSETLDPEGDISLVDSQADISEEILQKTLPDFQGDILQKPPIFSALKMEGERAYKKARRGEEFEIPERPVHIFSLELQKFFLGNIPGFEHDVITARISLHVGSGFYVRSFARDLGEKLGTSAICSALQRDQVGNFSLINAVSVDDISEKCLIPLTPEHFDLSSILLSDQQKKDILHGKTIAFEDSRQAEMTQKDSEQVKMTGMVALFDEEGWRGFGQVEGNQIFPKRVIPL